MPSPLLFSLSALAAPDHAYVQADVLRLRSSASASSAVVARLPINTRVTLLAEDGDHIQVRSDAQPDVVGWIDPAYLDATPLTAEQALQASRDARDIEESTLWVERALAISPTTAVVEQATRIATDLPVDAAEALHQRIAAASASWFAWCGSGRATLLGRMDGDNWTYALDIYPVQGEALLWDRVLPPGLDAIPFSSGQTQTHFPDPQLTEMSMVEEDDDSTTGDIIDLGRCSEPGLLASPGAQLEVIRKSPFADGMYVAESIEIADVEYAQQVNETLVEGYRTTMKPFFSCGGEGEVRPAIEVGIFSSDGQPLRPFGQQKDSDIGYTPFSISYPSWLQIQVNGEPTTVFTAGEQHELSSAAWMVFVHPDGETTAQQLVTRRYGC